jgi:hypothetical protein
VFFAAIAPSIVIVQVIEPEAVVSFCAARYREALVGISFGFGTYVHGIGTFEVRPVDPSAVAKVMPTTRAPSRPVTLYAM